MDASELTRRRRARTLYTNNVYRQNAIATGLITNKPATSGNQIGDRNGVDYNEWKNYITVGPTTISRAELDAIFAEPPAPAPPPTFNATFAAFIYPTVSANWVYRIYNTTTSTWTALLDTGYPTASWTFQSRATKSNYFALSLYNEATGNKVFLFIDSQGLLVNTITVPFTDIGYYRYAKNYFYVLTTTNIQLYNPQTQILQTATVGSISSTEYLDSGLFFVSGALLSSYYMWPLGAAAPILIATSSNNNKYQTSYTDDIVVLVTYDGSYYNKIYVVFSNGTSTSYTLPPSTYTNVYIQLYGINSRYTFVKCSAGPSVDYYVFPNILGTISPKIVPLTAPFYYIESFYSTTYAPFPIAFESNHLVITNYSTFNGVNNLTNTIYNTGNFIAVAAGNNQSLYFINNFALYGTVKHYIDSETGDFAGYVIGSNVAGQPHTSIVYMQSGNALIGCFGRYAHNANSPVQTDDNSYITETGHSGIWWSLNRSTPSNPSPCEVWFTIESESHWNTTRDAYVDRNTNIGPNQNSIVDISGTNFVLGKIVLAATTGNTIDRADLGDYITAYVTDAVQHLFTDDHDFTTISGEAYKTWHNANASAYLTDLSNNYVYAYTQIDNPPPPQFAEATVYVSISGENFTTHTYSSPHLISKHIALNQDVVLLIEGNNHTNKHISRIITGTTNTTLDLSGGLPTNQYPVLDFASPFPYASPSQQRFFYFNTETIPTEDPIAVPIGTSYWIINNSNIQEYHELGIFGSAVLLPYYNGSALTGSTLVTAGFSPFTLGDVIYNFIFQNGTLTKYTANTFDSAYQTHEDTSSGVVFGLKLDGDASRIVTITNTGITGATFTFLGSDNIIACAADHLLLISCTPHIYISIWDSTGTRYLYENSSIHADNEDISYWSTPTKFCFMVKNYDTLIWFYIIFDIATHTYTDTLSLGIEANVDTLFYTSASYPLSI